MTVDRLLVVVDGAVDLPLSHSSQVRVARGEVRVGQVCIEGSAVPLWERLRKGSYPSTAPPTVSALAAAYDQDGPVVGVHVSAALSATVVRANEAAARVEADGGHRVTVVDTRSLSVGSGLVAATLVNAASRPDADATSIVGTARRLPDLLHTFALVQDVDALRASGRAGLLPTAGLARHRPLILAVRGRAVALEQCRDRRAAVDRLAGHLRHSLGLAGRSSATDFTWALGHGDAADVAAVTERLSDCFGRAPRFVVPVDPTVGAHVGPDALIAASLAGDGEW